MQLLSKCRLSIDGVRADLTGSDFAAAGTSSEFLKFDVAPSTARLLLPKVGRTGVVESRGGIVLLRMKLLHVDAGANVILGEYVRAG